MKTPRFLLLILAAMLALVTPRQAQARVETSFDFFYDSLSPYGEWVQVADYGYCWRPTDVDPDWAPYSDGYWAYTDAGWTWVSYEDFGGIVYHYGRWTRVEGEGWCWVPEYEWGPAWVSWRNSDEYVGWAPLPPEARWQPSVGISVWCDRDYDIGPGYYSFCRVRDFGAPVLRPVIINRFENVTIIRHTVNITNISYNTHYRGGGDAVIFNGGPNFVVINQRSARPIPALKLVQNADIDLSGLRNRDHRRNFNGQAIGNQLVVSAPFVKPPSDPAFLKTKATKVFAADKVTHGWGGVKDEGTRRELRDELQRQTKGLTRDTAPAKAVAAADLKVLPEKADPQAPSPVTQRERPDKKGRMSESGNPASGPDGGNNKGPSKSGPTAVVPQNPDEKPNRENGRGPQKPGSGDPNLKPFNPAVTETDPNPNPRKGKSGGPANAESGNAERQAEIVRQRQEAQAAAKQQQQQQMEAQAAAKQQQQQLKQQQMEAQRQAEARRQQQSGQGDPSTPRQKFQGGQGGPGRGQGDGQAGQQNQNQAENLRRQQQQQQQQAAEQQQRRQQMQQQQQQQQQQREANEARRAAQEGQRPPSGGQGGQRPQQRVGPPNGQPANPTATPGDGRKKKDKDKDKDNQ